MGCERIAQISFKSERHKGLTQDATGSPAIRRPGQPARQKEWTMVFDVLRRKPKPVETKTAAPARVIGWHGASAPGWSPRDAGALTRNGFAANPVGYRAVKMIAEAAAALPLVLQDDNRRYDSHPILALLDRPNCGQGRAEFLEALFGHLLLSGNAYIEGAGSQDMAQSALPTELHILRPDRMSVVPGADGWPVAYDYEVSGRRHRYGVLPARPFAICAAFTLRMTTTGFQRCRLRRWRWMCIRRRRAGQRRSLIMQRVPRGRWCGAVVTARA